jgi:hypothetical protein
MPDFETSILIVLNRIAGALECLCEHFGAMPADGRRKANKKARGGR